MTIGGRATERRDFELGSLYGFCKLLIQHLLRHYSSQVVCALEVGTKMVNCDRSTFLSKY